MGVSYKHSHQPNRWMSDILWAQHGVGELHTQKHAHACTHTYIHTRQPPKCTRTRGRAHARTFSSTPRSMRCRWTSSSSFSAGTGWGTQGIAEPWQPCPAAWLRAAPIHHGLSTRGPQAPAHLTRSRPNEQPLPSAQHTLPPVQSFTSAQPKAAAAAPVTPAPAPAPPHPPPPLVALRAPASPLHPCTP